MENTSKKIKSMQLQKLEEIKSDLKFSYKLLVSNGVRKGFQSYECYFCQETIEDDHLIILGHLNCSQHTKQTEILSNKLSTIKTAEVSENRYQKLVENGIIIKKGHFFCSLCQEDLDNFQKIKNHANEKNHKSSLKKLQKKPGAVTNEVKPKSMKADPDFKNHSEEKCSVSVEVNSVVKQGAIKKIHTKGSEPSVQNFNKNKNASTDFKPNVEFPEEYFIKCVCESSDLYICTICKVYILRKNLVNAHVNSPAHRRCIKKSKVKGNSCDLKFFKPSFEISEKLYCKKCDFYLPVDETRLQCHCLMHLFKEQPYLNLDIIKFYFDGDNEVSNFILCFLCHSQLHNEEEVADHVKAQEHIDKLKDFNQINHGTDFDVAKTLRLSKASLVSLNFKADLDIICVSKASDSNKFVPSEFSLDDNTYYFKCFLCSLPMLDVKSLIKHYNENKDKEDHFKRYKCYRTVRQNFREQTNFY